ncbi:MAG: FHA domain-containing protein [Deltaproteobacteria bacterium]|nr:FHA domain-containing protein [Deltaproteobacteria bacterium]
MPNIRIVSSDGRISHFHILKDETTIGRGKDNDITLSDNTVSRHHALIRKNKEGYLLTDLGSFNGTIVNEESIQRVLLRHDDQIKIGPTKLTFSTKDKVEPSLTESLILIPETDEEKDDQKIIQSSPQADYQESGELLISVDSMKSSVESDLSIPVEGAGQKLKIEEDLSSLERSNKVLFVLYEISRQLNSISDFNELLNKIMDLIFMVIDADYGFLILTGDKEREELIPVVVKCRDDQIKDKGKLKASRTIVNKVIKDKVALLTSNAMADSRLDHGKSLFLQQIRSAMCVPLWKKDKIIGVIQLDSIRLDNQFDQDDLELLKTIGSQMAMIIEQASLNEQIREEERMRSRLERFHSPQVIEMILGGGQATKDNIMEPKDHTATILFTDIIGFTRLSEKMPPREINMILNQFFSRMTDIIFEYDGTLDKYIGDALMAVFGAPMEKEDDAERAILAALKMRQELAIMMEQTGPERQFDVRIGINTGRVVAGNIGSPKRMDYTVIGDPVNIASRLESIAQPNQILIGEETYMHVKDTFMINRVGARQVKGKSAEIMVYEVVG